MLGLGRGRRLEGRRRVSVRMVVCLCLTVVSASGCSTECSGGCFPGLSLSLVSPAPLDTEAVIRFELDDDVLSCDFNGDVDDPAQCEEAGARLVFGGGEQLEQILFRNRFPERVSVRIDVAGDIVLEATVSPDYTEVEFDGPDCPTCRAGTGAL